VLNSIAWGVAGAAYQVRLGACVACRCRGCSAVQCILLLAGCIGRAIDAIFHTHKPSSPACLLKCTQTEGALTAGNRSISVWDKYVKDNPSKIRDGSNAEVTCDFYNKYKEDIALMKDLGIKNYRLSVSWGRIVPSGRKGGAINQAGVDYYNSVIDELIKAGISPAVTLYHWDLPQANQDAYKVGGLLGPWDCLIGARVPAVACGC